MMVYDNSGVLLSHSWANHEIWSYTYTSGKLTSVNDGWGRQLVFTYISNPGQYNDGQLWRVGDQTATGLSGGTPAGRYIEFAYTTQKNNGSVITSPKALLYSVRDVMGQVWTYDYYGQHSCEAKSNQLDFLTASFSPSVDTNGDGVVDGPITLKKIAYNTTGPVITNLQIQRGLQGSGSSLLTTDLWPCQNKQ
jgi:YD repeat-containing protein